MLRVEFIQNGNGTLLVRLEGRLVGPYAEDARTTMASYKVPGKIIVDLTEMTFIDSSGEEMLRLLGYMGGEFIAENVYAQAICEQLGLRVAENGDGIGTRHRRRRSEVKT
jgi:anti-anti-sigma regulatory factor